MGLLDEVLGSLTGQAMGNDPRRQPTQPSPPTQARTGGMDTRKLLMTMLPIVLSMLSNRRAQTQSESTGQAGVAPSAGGGGLGGILGQVLGGAGGGAAMGGGLGGLLQQLQRAGFGAEADSWVSSGQNRPLPPDAMGKVFGRDGLHEIAERTGYSESDVSRGLSQLLPEVVDRVTPSGRVPDLDSLGASVDDLARRLGQR